MVLVGCWNEKEREDNVGDDSRSDVKKCRQEAWDNHWTVWDKVGQVPYADTQHPRIFPSASSLSSHLGGLDQLYERTLPENLVDGSLHSV